MRMMMLLSLILNIAVLAPVCTGLITDATWARASYGDASHARSILLSVYLAIGIVSVLLLFWRDPKLVTALLLVQVIYKLTTPLTVGTFAHPVVMSNVVIAAFHAATLCFIWRGTVT